METLEEILKPIKKEDWLEESLKPSRLMDRIIEEATSNEIWVTAYKIEIPVKSMGTSHIHNCIKCFNGVGGTHIPSNYLGGKDKWLVIFYNELSRR